MKEPVSDVIVYDKRACSIPAGCPGRLFLFSIAVLLSGVGVDAPPNRATRRACRVVQTFLPARCGGCPRVFRLFSSARLAVPCRMRAVEGMRKRDWSLDSDFGRCRGEQGVKAGGGFKVKEITESGGYGRRGWNNIFQRLKNLACGWISRFSFCRSSGRVAIPDFRV